VIAAGRLPIPKRTSHFALLVLHFTFAALLAGRACADPPLPPKLDSSVARGLEFLAAAQGVDGSFGANQKTAITSLALMSFLAAGHTPDVGRYGANVRNAIDYLLSQTHPDGAFARNEKPMYQQGIGTLALAEAYGVETDGPQRKRIAAFLAKSVTYIVEAQKVKKQDVYAGGWRYEPNAPDSDMSLSGWNALALRACEDAGIPVPREAAQRAVQFVLKCYNAQAKGFAYQPGGAASPGMTGVGVLCLHVLDTGVAHREATAAAASLEKHPIDDKSQFPYYAMYYATQAANQSGDAAWGAVSKATFEQLLKSQQPDGGWPDTPAESTGAGRAYSTSMAVLTLTIPYRLLPAYQR